MDNGFLIYWLLFIGLILGLFSIILLWLRRFFSRNEQHADILKRLAFVIEKESAARLQAQDRQQYHLDQLEKELFSRLKIGQDELSERLYAMNARLVKEQSSLRIEQAKAMQELTEQNGRNLMILRQSVTENLNHAVEEQMQSSFQRVLAQFSEIQKMMGEVSSVTVQIGDLKRLFTNVKTRGGWGEAQLRSILDDILPTGTYEANVRLRENSQEVVEFAVYMPAQGGHRPLLPIDSKFPTEAYERLLQAVEEGNSQAEQAARKSLESIVKQEAKKIAAKYIVPPKTVDFGILYVPTDGLYAEIARIPGLIDEVGRLYHILILSPALMPPLLRTVHLGYVSLALSEKTEDISKILGKTRQEMIRIDAVFEKLSRNTETMSATILEARRKTQKMVQNLQDIGNVEAE